MSKLNPRPQIGDIWQVYKDSPMLLIDFEFDKEFNTHVAVFRHLTGRQNTYSVPIISIRQGVGIWVKIA